MSTETTSDTTAPVEEKLLPELSDSEVRRFAKATIKKMGEDSVHEERKEKTKQVEKAFAIWYATSRSWMDQICVSSAAMIARIKADRSSPLGCMFADSDIDRFETFSGELLDAATRLNDVYALIGKPLVDPVDVMDEE